MGWHEDAWVEWHGMAWDAAQRLIIGGWMGCMMDGGEGSEHLFFGDASP